MADLLTHVLVAFIVFTSLSWAVDWFDRKWVVVGMVGALFPDLTRISLAIDPEIIRNLLGIPFSWSAISTLGGVVLLSGIGAVLFADARHRRVAFGALFGGGFLHLFVDGLVAWADGHGDAYLYPLTHYRIPTPGLYVTSDPRVLAVAVGCAIVVFAVDRYVDPAA